MRAKSGIMKKKLVKAWCITYNKNTSYATGKVIVKVVPLFISDSTVIRPL